MRKDIIIKVIGAFIAYSVLVSARFLPYGITLITSSQGHPIIILTGLMTTLGWLSGVVAATLLIMARSSARWFLMSYFLLGLVGLTVGWIPFISVLIHKIRSPYYELAIMYTINLAVLILVFALFNKIRRSDRVIDPKIRLS